VEREGQLLAGAREALPEGFRGDADDTRGFGGLEVFHAHQQQGLAVFDGKDGERRVDGALRLAGDRGALGGRVFAAVVPAPRSAAPRRVSTLA